MSKILKISLGVLGIGLIAALLLPALGEDWETSPRRRLTHCKMRLKQNAIMVQQYFTEHPEVRRFPVGDEARGKISPAAAEYWGFDKYMLVCPVRRDDPQPVRDYEWNPALAGGIYAEWAKPDSPILCDATPHHFTTGSLWNKKEYRSWMILFGDGHIEEAKNKPW